MAPFFSKAVDRRTALETLGLSGLGLFALSSMPACAFEQDSDSLNKLLPKFTAESRKRLLEILNAQDFSGQIPAAEAKRLVMSDANGIEAVMVGLLPLARTYARPPISKFLVGAVARGVSGSLYLGANIEFPGLPLGFSVHAEQAALSNAYMHSDEGVSAIAVTAAPCGHCRQFMNELSPEGQIEILLEGHPTVKLSALLPMAFGPRDLGFKDGAFPVKEVDLVLPDAPSDALSRATVDAARKSYARYTKAQSGVAIGTKAGRIYKGSYIENAAFNPSLSPFQAALVGLIVAGEDLSAISRVVLAEVNAAKISQEIVTEVALSAIAPTVRLEVLNANINS
jgi:cytidine deaminase